MVAVRFSAWLVSSRLLRLGFHDVSKCHICSSRQLIEYTVRYITRNQPAISTVIFVSAQRLLNDSRIGVQYGPA
jgi:hypothetical protein